MVPIVTFLILLFLRVPVFVSLGAATLLALLVYPGTPLMMIAQRMFHSLDSTPLMAGPFFILAGTIMVRGKVAGKLIDFVKEIVCFIPGGLGIAGILACGIFAAISGSANATLLAIGTIMIPAITETYGDEGFGTGLITTASTVGIIIPPSIPMIIYAATADLSIGKMFLGGFGPGFLILFAMCVYAYCYGKMKSMPTTRLSASRLWNAFKGAIWALFLPIIILGSIYTGMATPTEAAVLSVFYCLFIEGCIYRDLKLRDLKEIMIDSAIIVATIFIIIANASVTASYMTLELIPVKIAKVAFELIQSPWAFLVSINFFLLLMGCMMDIISATLIMVPVFLQFTEIYNINPYHFALIFLVNMDIGYYTPPIGLNLFIASMLIKRPITDIARYVIPTFIVMLLCLAIITYWPSLTLFLIEFFMPFD